MGAAHQAQEHRAVLVRFTVRQADFAFALRVAAVVTPLPLTSNRRSGAFLLVARRDPGRGATCSIHSRSKMAFARSTCQVSELDVEGRCAVVAEHLLRWVLSLPRHDDTITFEARTHDVLAERRYWSEAWSDSGSHFEHQAFDPRLLSACDSVVERAAPICTVPSPVLARGLRTVQRFTALPRDRHVSAAHSGILAAPEGRLVTFSGMALAIFESSALQGARFGVPREQVATLLRFLRRQPGPIALHAAERDTVAVNRRGDVYGWTRPAMPNRSDLSDYPSERDEIVARVDRARLGRGIAYLRTTVGTKATVVLDVSDHQVRLRASDRGGGAEFPVPTLSFLARGQVRRFVVPLKRLALVVESARDDEVELRFALFDRPRFALLRIRERCTVRGSAVGGAAAFVTRIAILGLQQEDSVPSDFAPAPSGGAHAE